MVAFLNRLPRVTSAFCKGFSKVTGCRAQFSSFLTMPLASDTEDITMSSFDHTSERY